MHDQLSFPKTPYWCILLLAVSSIISCIPATQKAEYDKIAESYEGMVVSAHPIATKVGVEILRSGGNAVDAAIAVQLALAVVYPRAGNIGGGGFMIYRSASGETAALDFREKAPALAHRDMYLNGDGEVIPDLSTSGALAVGVPGTIAGIFAAHKRYGSLPVQKLFQPAIRIAKEGHAITADEAERLNEMQKVFKKHNSGDIPFIRDTKWREGDSITHPHLAETLQRIATVGPDEFYKGETAVIIVKTIQEGGGIITSGDLEAYEVVWRDPVVTDFEDYRIITMPLPSSGGIALSQLLKISALYPLKDMGFHSIGTIHLMAEAARRVYADRAHYLGDADHFHVPVDSLLNSGYLQARMHDFTPDSASQSVSIRAGQFSLTLESFETTHLTVVDGEGNAVAVTTTLNTNYGSKVFAGDGGFFLNNEMDDFSVKPGVPNHFGLVGGEANAIAPCKRMLSSMTPTIVEHDGAFFMTLGTPGGPTIITSVFQVFVNVATFGMGVADALAAPRFHHQWLPDEIMVEHGAWPEETMEALHSMGHMLRSVRAIGLMEVICRQQDGRLIGVSDPRGHGHAAGL